MKPSETEAGQPAGATASAAVLRIHGEIIDVLRGILRSLPASPLDPGFRGPYRRFLSLFDRYQHECLEAEGRTPTCTAGCAACCWHWVEDVYSFEIEIIADRLLRDHPGSVPAVIAACRADTEVMERLDRKMDTAWAARPGRLTQGALDERTERLLNAFYALRRPCPLLTAERRCLAYDVRPLSCRVYLSFSPPSRCDPAYKDERDVPTTLVDLDESASTLLDELHARYDRFDNDTSLRSALVACLGQLAGGRP